jgi:hypothetical protein
LFWHFGQSWPWLQFGQRSQARLLLSAPGSMGKGFTGGPYRVGRGGEGWVLASPFCTLRSSLPETLSGM